MNDAIKPTPGDVDEIDAFCDALWLEDGLAKATLDSYRADLTQLAAWLAATGRGALLAVGAEALVAYIAKVANDKKRATSQLRYLSSLRRFYRWHLGRGRIVTDPTLKLVNPHLPARLP